VRVSNAFTSRTSPLAAIAAIARDCRSGRPETPWRDAVPKLVGGKTWLK